VLGRDVGAEPALREAQPGGALARERFAAERVVIGVGAKRSW
jgi:hypothetical protein